MQLTPKGVTAFLVGLKTRFAVFGLQREINEFRGEPLLAILPGVTLQELWDLMGNAELLKNDLGPNYGALDPIIRATSRGAESAGPSFTTR